MSKAVSFEVRAAWNENKKQGKYMTNNGLSCFSPVINIMRHPLWGRNQVNKIYKDNVHDAEKSLSSNNVN